LVFTFLAAVLKTAKPRPHWPKDYALNHGHYVSGEPKKIGMPVFADTIWQTLFQPSNLS